MTMPCRGDVSKNARLVASMTPLPPPVSRSTPSVAIRRPTSALCASADRPEPITVTIRRRFRWMPLARRFISGTFMRVGYSSP